MSRDCMKRVSKCKKDGCSCRNTVIYLATPYTHESKEVEEERFKAVTILSGLLVRDGIVNFSPITQSHEQNRLVGLPGTWDYWQYVDEVILKRCDELWIFANEGWQKSVGVQGEVDIAIAEGMPILYVKLNEDQTDFEFISEEEAKEIL